MYEVGSLHELHAVATIWKVFYAGEEAVAAEMPNLRQLRNSFVLANVQSDQASEHLRRLAKFNDAASTSSGRPYMMTARRFAVLNTTTKSTFQRSDSMAKKKEVRVDLMPRSDLIKAHYQQAVANPNTKNILGPREDFVFVTNNVLTLLVDSWKVFLQLIANGASLPKPAILMQLRQHLASLAAPL